MSGHRRARRAPTAPAEIPLAKVPPAVQVDADEHTVDVRAWARGYVRTLLELEGVIAPSSDATLPRAS